MSRSLPLAIALGVAVLVVACGKKEPPAATEATAPAAATGPSAAPVAVDQSTAAAAQPAAPTSWTPEALEELLAPVALYPDPMLSQVLIASTNPQEVLDAGNWVIDNQGLKGKALDDAAVKIGFTPPVLALIKFPDTLDMMCRELDWTTELGQAFTADQAGVLDAVQRLRKQAEAVGNLKTSPQMTVVNEEQDGQEVVILKPAANGEVYVPQYDPVAVYAPAPATTAVAPAATTTTTESTGHSTGALVATGLLAFGAGMLVNELFDDDDDYHHHGYYYPSYGYGRMPYYPPYPYRPAYGNGYYPSNGYRPPGGYGNNYVNNGNVVINTGGNRNNYWNNYNKERATPYNGARNGSSPITAARPNRPEMNDLNKRQPRPMPADVQRPNPNATASDWQSKKTYKGAESGGYKGKATGAQASTREMPKTQGSYGGSAGNRGTTPQGAYKGGSSDRAQTQQGGYKGTQQAKGTMPSQGGNAAGKAKGQGSVDRGYGQAPSRQQPTGGAQQRDRTSPSAQPSQMQSNRGGGGGGARSNGSAMSGSDRGSADRAASQRGKQSMPQGAHSKGGGGGGGGKKGKR